MEALSAVFAIDGIWLLVVGASVAGLVRGFSGFGTAMVYLPFAGQVLPPFEALTTMIIMDMFGPIPIVPRALRDGHPRDVLRLGVGMVVALPLGVLLLSMIAADVFRYGVSFVSLALLGLLVAGVRYNKPLKNHMMFAAGGLAGFLGGSVGLAGPPVIMLYMASPHPAEVIRANTLLFLILADIAMIVVFQIGGHLVVSAIFTGIILVVPYLLANLAGAAIFKPGRERVYRAVAYLIIAVSALSGLPLLD